MHSALVKSNETFNLKPREPTVISQYLPSQAEVMMEDTRETLKQRYNTAWTIGFLKQNQNVEFKPMLKNKKSNLKHFPASLRQSSPNTHFTPYMNLGSIYKANKNFKEFLPHHVIHIGFATAGVVSAQTTVDICRKVTRKIFYFWETLNAFVGSHMIPGSDMK